MGASIAGLTASESLRAEGFDGEILLIGDENHLPYSRPALSKQVLLHDWDAAQVTLRPSQDLENLNIKFLGGIEALHLDVDARKLFTSAGEFTYDSLIIATGTKARRVAFDESIPTLRTLDDAFALRNQMKTARKIAVLGAGVLGSEIATAGTVLGGSVTLVGRSSSLSLGAVGDSLSSRIEKLHLDQGVKLRLNSSLIGITATAKGKALHFSDGEDVEADLVVAAIGATPSTQWLEGSGITLGDGIVCDHRGKAAPEVYAIGDVAAWPDPFSGEPVRVEHQSNAIEQAMAVAGTLVNNSAHETPVPFFWSEIHGVRIKAYGWFDREPLADLETNSQNGALLAAQSGTLFRGVIAWGASPKEFTRARLLVDGSLNLKKMATSEGK